MRWCCQRTSGQAKGDSACRVQPEYASYLKEDKSKLDRTTLPVLALQEVSHETCCSPLQKACDPLASSTNVLYIKKLVLDALEIRIFSGTSPGHSLYNINTS